MSLVKSLVILLTPHQLWSRSKYARGHSRNLVTPYFESNDQGLIWIYTYPVTSCMSSVLRLSCASPATWKGHPSQGRILPLKGDMSWPLDQIQETASCAAGPFSFVMRRVRKRELPEVLWCDKLAPWGWGVIVEYFSTTKRCSIPPRACVCTWFWEKKTSHPTCSYIDSDVWYIFCMKSLQFLSLHHFGRLCPNLWGAALQSEAF